MGSRGSDIEPAGLCLCLGVAGDAWLWCGPSEASDTVGAEAVSQLCSTQQEVSVVQFHDGPTSRQDKRRSAERVGSQAGARS